MQTNLFRRSAILIEQNPLQGRLYEDVLKANGFDVYIAKSAMDGLVKVKETTQDLIVINTEIAEESFMEKLVSKVRSESASSVTPVIGLSIYNRERKKNIAKALDAFLTKPLSIDKFIESVFNCLESKANGSKNTINQ
jgi:two-component system cell cycle response regulator DivK